MSRLDRLDTPLTLGPVRLANRAVLLAESYGLASEHGGLSDLAFDWLVEQAREGWGMIMLGLDAPGCPSSAALDPEALRRLHEATRSVEVALAYHVDEPWSEREDAFVAAGTRVFERFDGSIDRTVLVGRRVATPDEVTAVEGADFVHLGPSPSARRSLVGGTLRQPYGYELQGLAPPQPIPVLFSGRVKDAVSAERVLQYYPVDLVGIGRGALAAPRLLDAARRGEDWMPCTGCMACLAPERFPRPGCAVTPNHAPELGWGERSSWDVVGASLAALRLAVALHEAGHDVSVYTCGEPVGGAVRRRGRIPQQAESMEAAVYLRGKLRRRGVALSPEFPETLDADHVVVSLPDRLVPQQGWNVGDEWLDGFAVLADTLHERGPFEVWGDTLLAAELAAFFAMTARRATLRCAADEVASDTHPAWRAFYLDWFERHGVEVGAEAGEGRVVVAGRASEPHRALQPILDARPDAIVVPDAYEPFAQRAALERAFEAATARLA